MREESAKLMNKERVKNENQIEWKPNFKKTTFLIPIIQKINKITPILGVSYDITFLAMSQKSEFSMFIFTDSQLEEERHYFIIEAILNYNIRDMHCKNYDKIMKEIVIRFLGSNIQHIKT